MTKRKRKLTAQQRAEKKRRRQEYMTIFVGGKQKRVKRPPTIEGISVQSQGRDRVWKVESAANFHIPDTAPFRLFSPNNTYKLVGSVLI
jgi:hypothetical protein